MNYKDMENLIREKMDFSVRNIADKQNVLRQRLESCAELDNKLVRTKLFALKCEEHLARDAEEMKENYNDIKLHILKQNEIRQTSKQLKTKYDGLLCAVEGQEELNSKDQEIVKSNRTVLEKRQETIMKKLAPLRSDNELYRRFLGLDVTATKGKTLLFSFKHISRDDPDKLYTFQLDIKDSVYNVSQCDPPLPGIEETLHELNMDDNFIHFVVEMRKKMVFFVKDESV